MNSSNCDARVRRPDDVAEPVVHLRPEKLNLGDWGKPDCTINPCVCMPSRIDPPNEQAALRVRERRNRLTKVLGVCPFQAAMSGLRLGFEFEPNVFLLA